MTDTPAASPRLPSAPAGSPNVVVMVFDDLGFGQLGCYGSPIETPHIDALAAGGLRYNRFHVTSLCSPSRAALLTGRNHHRVGVGFLVDLPVDAPGYHARRPRTIGTLPQALVDAGYSAWAVGKWHLVPMGSRSHAGPFEMWPLGWGFERFYGFLGGDTNQWTPELVQDNHYVDPPRSYEEGYHLSEDLAERLIRNIRDQRQATPTKPFFAYHAFGAMHAPHHVARQWVEPYRGRFDAGWDELRRHVHHRQVTEGIIPATARLTERPEWVAPWSSLDADARRLFTAMYETYAGFLSHTDAQIGRVVKFLRSIGELDNTIIMVMSDNGASAEAGVMGTVNEHRFTTRMPESTARSLPYADDWGGPDTYSHYSWGWAHAGNTPFKLWKRYAWLGGTRSPLVVHWPSGITARGEVRAQIGHIIDVMPTILDACGVPLPRQIGGIPQESFDGASLQPTFADSGAPSPRDTQYFEMLGSRSIISGPWKATTDHVSRGVGDEELLMLGSRDFSTDRWSLHRMADDYSEAVDVADQHPEVVAELAARWDAEAERNGVFPLKDNLIGTDVPILPPPYPPNSRMTYHPDASPARDDLMPRLGMGGAVTARVTIASHQTDTPHGADGVVWQIGDVNCGMALVVIDGCPAVTLSTAGEPVRAAASDRLIPGDHELAVLLQRPDGDWPRLALAVDGVVVADATSAYGFPFVWQHGGTALSIGRGRGFSVDHSYRNPFPFAGTVHDVTIDGSAAAARTVGDLRRALQVE